MVHNIGHIVTHGITISSLTEESITPQNSVQEKGGDGPAVLAATNDQTPLVLPRLPRGEPDYQSLLRSLGETETRRLV